MLSAWKCFRATDPASVARTCLEHAQQTSARVRSNHMLVLHLAVVRCGAQMVLGYSWGLSKADGLHVCTVVVYACVCLSNSHPRLRKRCQRPEVHDISPRVFRGLWDRLNAVRIPCRKYSTVVMFFSSVSITVRSDAGLNIRCYCSWVLVQSMRF